MQKNKRRNSGLTTGINPVPLYRVRLIASLHDLELFLKADPSKNKTSITPYHYSKSVKNYGKETIYFTPYKTHTSNPHIVQVVSILDVPRMFGSISFQSNDVNGAQ